MAAIDAPSLCPTRRPRRKPAASRQRTGSSARTIKAKFPGRCLCGRSYGAGEPIAKLLDLLKEPEDRVRYRARIELANRPTDEVIREADRWLAGQSASDPNYEHHRLEILWLHQSHNVVNEQLLKDAVRVRIPQLPNLEDHTVGLDVYVVGSANAEHCDAGHMKIS